MTKVIIFNGSKKEMNKCKKAFLHCSSSYEVYTKRLEIIRESIFNYRLEVVIEGDSEIQIKSFFNKVISAHKLLNGNILGLKGFI